MVVLHPAVGLGTCHIKDDVMKSVIAMAIDAGYRHFDTAFSYPNEKAFGSALKEILKSNLISREKLFIISKLPWHAMHPSSVEYFCRKSLENLNLDYLDLYLVHSPVPTKRTEDDNAMVTFEGGKVLLDNVDHLDTWKAMEKLVEKGIVKSIGLSNFNSKQIQRIYDAATIKPCNLQIEVHAYLPQFELVNFVKSLGMTVTACAPLGSPEFPTFARESLGKKDYNPPSLLEDEKLKPLAAKYNKTPAQILLRYLVQRGISVIPKSDIKVWIEENINIFDFVLDENDVSVLKSMSCGMRYFKHDYFNGLTEHPEYPFNIPF